MASKRTFQAAATFVFLVASSLSIAGCLPPATICVPGNYSPCQCPDGTYGNRRCNDEGSAFESSCICDLKDYSNQESEDVIITTPDVSDARSTEAIDAVESSNEDSSTDSVYEEITALADLPTASLDLGENADLPCNEDPWKCPEGQTCWLGGEPNIDGSWDGTFECLNSRPNGQAGCSCTLKIGIPSCADNLYCLVLIGAQAPEPHCANFCDNKNPEYACPVGFYCGPVTVGSESINLCIPESGSLNVKDCSVSP